ncbi:hypothetical protein ACGFZ3_11880 [Stenotrophomonas sp. NPDC047960]|uniref:hypothetical protein n=1 Tax=Stenotrophomonas sp. NPDC047960 TaxID=3364531 RepID=UPI003713BD58
MSNSATPDTVFNDTLNEAFDALKSGVNDSVAVRRLRKRADELSSIDAAGAWELRAYASAMSSLFDAADEGFARAVRLQPANSNLKVRWLAMLCVTGQAGKAKERFVEFRAALDGNFAAMQAVTSLLGYVGLLYDAFLLRERVAELGGDGGCAILEHEFGIASAPDRKGADAPDNREGAESLPSSTYKFSVENAVDDLSAQGLNVDAWSEPVGCAIQFLRERQLKVLAVRSSFIPHEYGPASMHFQILIDDVIDVTSIAESDFYDLLVERDFPIILSGGASIAFIPTIDEAIDADLT